MNGGTGSEKPLFPNWGEGSMSGDVDLYQRRGGRVGVCTGGCVLVYTDECMGRWNRVGACARSQRQELLSSCPRWERTFISYPAPRRSAGKYHRWQRLGSASW